MGLSLFMWVLVRRRGLCHNGIQVRVTGNGGFTVFDRLSSDLPKKRV